MENLDKNDLIERYLEGILSASEQETVAILLATDPAFQAEIELHRQIHQEFSDPKKLKLRDVMGDILRQEPAPPEVADRKWLKWLGLALIVLLGAGMIWWMSDSTAQKETPGAPSQPVQQIQPKATDLKEEPKQPEQATQNPIAMADKASFRPNMVFETRLGNGGIRSTDGTEIQINSPAPGADFSIQNGQVKVNFAGTVLADDDQEEFPLQINLYNNRSSDTPIAQFTPAISNRKEPSEKWNYTSRQTLRLPAGLYYYTLERRADAELIFVGKFTVDKKVLGGK